MPEATSDSRREAKLASKGDPQNPPVVTREAIVGKVNIAFVNSDQQSRVESDSQIHGLYQEDLTEGIICQECTRLAAISNQEYRRMVETVHNVTPKELTSNG